MTNTQHVGFSCFSFVSFRFLCDSCRLPSPHFLAYIRASTSRMAHQSLDTLGPRHQPPSRTPPTYFPLEPFRPTGISSTVGTHAQVLLAAWFRNVPVACTGSPWHGAERSWCLSMGNTLSVLTFGSHFSLVSCIVGNEGRVRSRAMVCHPCKFHDITLVKSFSGPLRSTFLQAVVISGYDLQIALSRVLI